jgi:hypothetical protein
VHEAYGDFLNAMGRLDEGLAESREAARLDPLSVQPFHDLAINALLRQDFAKAADGFRHTIQINPDWTWGYIKLARSLALEKKCSEAFVQAEIAERRIAGGVGSLSRAWLGSSYATCGDIVRARQKLLDCTPSKLTDTSIWQRSQKSTPVWAKSTRPYAGIRRRTTTAHPIWFSRRSAADSVRGSPPALAIARSWRRRHFRLRLNSHDGGAPFRTNSSSAPASLRGSLRSPGRSRLRCGAGALQRRELMQFDVNVLDDA